MKRVQKKAARSISLFAEVIREALGLDATSFTFDIKKIIKILGGTLIEKHDLIGYASVEKSGEESFVITVKKSIVGTPMARFSIAHELGHLFLHMGYYTSTQKWVKIGIGETYLTGAGKYTYNEEAADIFGAAFLMPENEFCVIAEEHSDDESYFIDEIAEKYGLPIERIETRGYHIGLWED